MKHLRQYIRQILLTEAAAQPEDLPDNVFVRIDANEEMVDIELVVQQGQWNFEGRPYYRPATDGSDGISGSIQMYKITGGEEDLGPCLGAWMISWAGASKGFGPLLYDTAMEYATLHGGGLISDRDEVSHKAQKVWDYYLNRRGDIESQQLDDRENTLTPGKEDNCDQSIAVNNSGGKYLDWQDSPLSKVYRKLPDTTIQSLKELGKWIKR